MRIKVVKNTCSGTFPYDSPYVNHGRYKTLRRDIPVSVPNPDYVPPASKFVKKHSANEEIKRLLAERDAALDVLCKLERLGISTLEVENIVVRKQSISPDGKYKMVSFIIAR